MTATDKSQHPISRAKLLVWLIPLFCLIPLWKYGSQTYQRRLTTNLHELAIEGDQVKMRALLDSGVDANRPLMRNGRAIELTLHLNHTDCTKLLLERGADPPPLKDSPYERYPMIEAAGDTGLSGQQFPPQHHVLGIEIVKMLLDRGGNVNERDLSGTTPLIAAVRHNKVEIAEELLRRGADSKLKDEKGRTALDTAKTSSHLRMVELLKSAGNQVHK